MAGRTRTPKRRSVAKKQKGKSKVAKVMKEAKAGKLHSGSKSGPLVSSRKQSIAIALSEAGMSDKKKKMKGKIKNAKDYTRG